MTGFFIGLSIGLLINRYSKKPLLQWPLRCWFLGHVLDKDEICERCRLYDPGRWGSTFWTS